MLASQVINKVNSAPLVYKRQSSRPKSRSNAPSDVSETPRPLNTLTRRTREKLTVAQEDVDEDEDEARRRRSETALAKRPLQGDDDDVAFAAGVCARQKPREQPPSVQTLHSAECSSWYLIST
ncbi:hypothetical protein K0M31_004597 [Melipona bicolor]|uniref:Uncharacterized protein n=1 Tax=Melipona bicolor TaxID=60889 RepID=A0AA40KNR5_9HYME|nr:hypothetical protein K0M31_004597 [Melipona bicolor]